MLGQSRKDNAAHYAARNAAFENTFAGQVKKIKDCQAGNNHHPAYDSHYKATFCTTCETELS